MTDASKEASRFHNQNPVILMPADRWLDHDRTDAVAARRLYCGELTIDRTSYSWRES